MLIVNKHCTIFTNLLSGHPLLSRHPLLSAHPILSRHPLLSGHPLLSAHALLSRHPLLSAHLLLSGHLPSIKQSPSIRCKCTPSIKGTPSIKRTPSIKQTLGKVPKVSALQWFHLYYCLHFYLAKHLTVRSSGCDSVRSEGCNYFCVTCLTQAQRNPLECPSHGPAEPLIGTVNYSIFYRRSSHTIILTIGL